MILATNFNPGVIFKNENNEIVQIMTCQHHRKSQARAVVRVKLQNMETKAIIETSYRPEDKFHEVSVEKREKTYMYSDGKLAYFMDTASYEQMEIPLEKLGDAKYFLVGNMLVEGLYLNEKFFNIQLPANIAMEVAETEPGIRGDSASNVTKQAKLVSGLDLKVPLFINAGDKIKVDTRTFQYLEREKEEGK